MEENITFSVQDLFWIASLIFSFGGGYAWLKFTTKSNSEKNKDIKDKVEKLETKCELMIEKEKAFESFVTKTIFDERSNHLTETMTDIKSQNNTIINLLTKGNK